MFVVVSDCRCIVTITGKKTQCGREQCSCTVAGRLCTNSCTCNGEADCCNPLNKAAREKEAETEGRTTTIHAVQLHGLPCPTLDELIQLAQLGDSLQAIESFSAFLIVYLRTMLHISNSDIRIADAVARARHHNDVMLELGNQPEGAQMTFASVVDRFLQERPPPYLVSALLKERCKEKLMKMAVFLKSYQAKLLSDLVDAEIPSDLVDKKKMMSEVKGMMKTFVDKEQARLLEETKKKKDEEE